MASSCTACGAPLEVPDGVASVNCTRCGIENRIDPSGASANRPATKARSVDDAIVGAFVWSERVAGYSLLAFLCLGCVAFGYWLLG